MKKKNNVIGNIIRIGALLLLMYASAAGNYINTGDEYYIKNMNLFGLIDVLIVSLLLMAVPFIWRIINEEKFPSEKGKRICKWNSIIVLILTLTISPIIFDGKFVGIGGLGAIIYYFINKWLFVDETKTESIIESKKDYEIIYTCSNCNYKTKKATTICKKCGEKFSKIELEPGKINKSVRKEDNKIAPTSKTRYCKLCGGKLNENKKCTTCGKQYFKITKEFILYGVIGILFVALVLSLCLYINNCKELEHLEQLEYEYSDLQIEYSDLQEEHRFLKLRLDFICNGDCSDEKDKLDFFDENIVFVIDGYGKKYYTYDCMYEITDDEYIYWAFNKEAVIADGYKKGTC